jgi:hypothetical protein
MYDHQCAFRRWLLQALLGTVLGCAALLRPCEAAGFQQPARSTASDSARALLEAQRILFEYLHPPRSYWSDVAPGEEGLEALARVRRALAPSIIAQLDRLGPRSYEDEWIVGQRVMIRAEHKLYEEALSAARTCAADLWWCKELEAFVLHLLGNVAESEGAFRTSLALMPPLERCFARDLLFLVDDSTRQRYARVGASRYSFHQGRGYIENACDEWTEIETRFWWLADPLYLLPGNDRYTEHRSRIVATWLLAHRQMAIPERGRIPGRATYRGMSLHWLQPEHWRDAVRRGWPPGTQALMGGWPPPRGETSFAFDPPMAVLGNPLALGQGVWRISIPTAPARYAPAYGPIADLEPQAAFFRRGDSVRVAVALDARGYATGIHASDSVTAGVVFSQSPSAPAVSYAIQNVGYRHHFVATLPDERYLLSIEILGHSGGAGRARYAAGLPTSANADITISDVMFFEWIEPAALDMEQLRFRMLGSMRLSRTDELGIYWEIYGLAAVDTALITILLLPAQPRWPTRLLNALRIRGSPSDVQLRWSDAHEEYDHVGIRTRALRLDLSRLRPGNYVFQLVADVRGEILTAARPVTLTR